MSAFKVIHVECTGMLPEGCKNTLTMKYNDIEIIESGQVKFEFSNKLYQILKNDLENNKVFITWNDEGRNNTCVLILEPKQAGGAFKKTTKRVKIGGRERVVYQGANRKQYIRAKGTYVPLAEARKKL